MDDAIPVHPDLLKDQCARHGFLLEPGATCPVCDVELARMDRALYGFSARMKSGERVDPRDVHPAPRP